MRFNLRYAVPVMCGTCIALTVSVAAAVSGSSDNGVDTPRLSAAAETESRVYHSHDFTAPAAYSAEDIVTAEETADFDGESSETRDSAEEAAQTAENSGGTAEQTENGDIAQIAESAEPSAETGEHTEEAVSDKRSEEALPETSEQTDEALPEENARTAEAAPETNEQPKEIPPEADKPAKNVSDAENAAYGEPQRQAMLDAVNETRAEYGLTALSEMPELSEIAQRRARECASSFSHTRPNGTKWHTLLSEAGLKRSVRAENIAYYYPTARQALDSWMNDYSHRINVLNPEAVYIGIGYYNDGYNPYWVQIFLGE